jgi:quercetin dioxygenase-like cupin family protein
MKAGLTHLCKDKLDWQRAGVHGAPMEKVTLFEGGHGVRSAFFKMPAGLEIPQHTHTKWVQVMVLEGCMQVEQEGSEALRVESGGVYFLNPGYPHVETALVDTIVFVTQGEDRPEWLQATTASST